MRSIDVEKPAPVRAQVLDALQGGHRSLRDGLTSPLQDCRVHVRVEVHRDPLPDQNDADQHCCRQEHPQQCANQVDPEVSQVGGAFPGEAAYKGDTDGQAARSCQEILNGQADDLAKVAHGRLSRVGLPRGCRGETDGGIHRQVRGHGRCQVHMIVPGQEHLQA